jgi:hypothetical protein
MPARKKKKLAGGRALRASCTATVILKEVIYYPEFQVTINYTSYSDFSLALCLCLSIFNIIENKPFHVFTIIKKYLSYSLVSEKVSNEVF